MALMISRMDSLLDSPGAILQPGGQARCRGPSTPLLAHPAPLQRHSATRLKSHKSYHKAPAVVNGKIIRPSLSPVALSSALRAVLSPAEEERGGISSTSQQQRAPGPSRLDDVSPAQWDGCAAARSSRIRISSSACEISPFSILSIRSSSSSMGNGGRYPGMS